MKSISLTLPYPISANRYWATRVVMPKGGGRPMSMTYVTPEAKAYKREVGWLCKAAGIRGPIKSKVALSFRLVPANGVCMDLDNCLKVAIDSLKDIAFLDDSQVYKITAERHMPDGRARLEVVIEEYVPPPAGLFALQQEREPDKVPF